MATPIDATTISQCRGLAPWPTVRGLRTSSNKNNNSNKANSSNYMLAKQRPGCAPVRVAACSHSIGRLCRPRREVDKAC